MRAMSERLSTSQVCFKRERARPREALVELFGQWEPGQAAAYLDSPATTWAARPSASFGRDAYCTER